MSGRLDPGPRVARHHAEGRGVTRVGYPIGIRTLVLVRTALVTPHMLRLTLGGPELAGFCSHQADDHVRLLLPDHAGHIEMPVVNADLELTWPRPAPASRKYTVRSYRREVGEIDIDVVLHEGGLASTWLAGRSPGDDVVVAGPPGAKAFAQTYSHYVFAVDPTALPAAARWLDESPPEVSADLVVETDHEDEQSYPLVERENVRTTWTLRTAGTSRLAGAVQRLSLPEDTFCFVAGEADDIRPLRAWARGRYDSLFTGYWRRGEADLDD